MSRPDRSTYFMQMLPLIASRSHDIHTKVGCIVAGPQGEIRSTGYNGFARGVDNDNADRLEKPEKYHWMVHSEINAICSAAKVGTPLGGCTIYVDMLPCMACARAIVQGGIVRMVVNRRRTDERVQQGGWAEESMDRLFQLINEAGVQLEWWEPCGE